MSKIFTLAALLTLSQPLFAQSGQVNPAFRGGSFTWSYGPMGSQAQDMATQPDGKLLVTGLAQTASGGQFATLRLNADGSPDLGFGTNGQVLTAIGGECWARAIVVQQDGKIIVGGDATINGNTDFAIVRYLSGGQLDLSFGNNGVVLTDFVQQADLIYDLALLPDGRIVAGGRAYNGTDYDFAVARYLPNGAPDANFNGGKVRTQVGSGNDFAWSLLVQPDGSVVQTGSSAVNGICHMALLRYLPNGQPDWGFGTMGKVITPVGQEDFGYGAALQSDGKIVLAGVVHNAAPNYTDAVLLRFLSNGTLDPGFGASGQVIVDIAQSADQLMDVAIQPDGKLVAAGHSGTGSHEDFLTMRFTGEGIPDQTFGTGGRTLMPVGAYDDLAYSVKLCGNSIYLAGIANTSPMGNPTAFALGALLNDGTPLPVRLLQLQVQRQNRLPIVEWQTSSETGADHFLVERRTDGRNFRSIARIAASGSASSYKVTDAQPEPATMYYRLKMNDADGRFTYSRIVALKNETAVLEVFPNPVRTVTQVQLPSGLRGRARVELVDAGGRVSLLSQVDLSGNTISLPVDLSNRAQGTYYLRASTSDWSATKAVVVQ